MKIIKNQGGLGRTHKDYFLTLQNPSPTNCHISVMEVYNPIIKCNLAHRLACWIHKQMVIGIKPNGVKLLIA